MQKERKIQEDFYEDLSDLVDFADTDNDYHFRFDPYTGVLTVVPLANGTVERRFRLVPCKGTP